MNAFAPKIDRVYGLLHLKTFLDDVVDGAPAEEILYPGGRPQPPGQPSDFLPEFFGSAAEAVEFVMRWVRDMCDDDTAARDELQEGLEAWDYLTDTIAIDFTNIEDRWRRLPRVLIPDHLARAGLLDLLRNAVDAHLVGAHAAAVVMCRAVCEKVLKKYYLDEEEYLEHNGRHKELGKVVFLAERKFSYVKEFKLRKHIEFANRVVHDYGRVEGNEEDIVRDFLETAKTLIEKAPKRTTT